MPPRRAGLREGDLILSVDNVEVASVKAFQAQVAKADKAKALSLVVRREDVTSFVLLKPSVESDVARWHWQSGAVGAGFSPCDKPVADERRGCPPFVKVGAG